MTQQIESEEAHCPVCGPEALSREVAHSPDFEYGTSGNHEWRFRECWVCDSVHLTPRPVRAALKDIYPANYYAYSCSTTASLGYAVKKRLDHLAARGYARRYPGTGLVCDIGAGDGRLVEALSDALPGQVAPYGIEPGVPAVAAARARGVDVRCASLEESGFEESSHGLLVMQQVIEHLHDPREAMGLAARALVPGGALIVETPNVAGIDRQLFASRYWGGYHTPRHLHLFNPRSLRRLGELHGLEVVATQALPSPNFWIQSLHHLASERRGATAAAFRRLLKPHPPGAVPLAVFTSIDLASAALFGTTSNMRVIFRRPA